VFAGLTSNCFIYKYIVIYLAVIMYVIISLSNFLYKSLYVYIVIAFSLNSSICPRSPSLVAEQPRTFKSVCDFLTKALEVRLTGQYIYIYIYIYITISINTCIYIYIYSHIYIYTLASLPLGAALTGMTDDCSTVYFLAPHSHFFIYYIYIYIYIYIYKYINI
jgi:hypothetical protein